MDHRPDDVVGRRLASPRPTGARTSPVRPPGGVQSWWLRYRLDAAVRPSPPASTGELLPAANLPPVVHRYLQFMGFDPVDRGGDVRIRFRGSFFKDGMGWMPATAWQFNSTVPIERRYVMRICVGQMLPMVATDVYRAGRGEMTGRLFGLRVAHGTGPEFDSGELVTWLNDAVLFAPAQLFDGGVSFVELDPNRFEATVTDRGTTVSGVVEVDPAGAPLLFSTNDRFADLPTGRIRAEWRTPVTAWGRTGEGRAVPVAASAVWMLDTGPLTYVRGGFDPASREVRRAR